MENHSTGNITIKRTVLLIGPPGSGKSTLGQALGTLPGCTFVSMGGVLRSSDPDSEVRRCQREGKLVPADLAITTWQHHVRQLVENGFKAQDEMLLLDGLPRNIEQAESLQDHVHIEHLIHLSCDDNSLLAERIRNRDDKREDDSDEAVIARRFEIYRQQTEPLLAWYRDETITSLDATSPPLEILHQVTGLLKKDPAPAKS